MNNKNIFILSQSLTSGGAERVAANLATELSKNNNVWLFILDNKIKTYTTSANVIELNTKNKNKILWYIEAIKQTKKYKKTLNIDYSISFLSKPDLLNILTKNKDKTIVSVRNKRSSLNRNIFNKLKDKFIFKKADRIVALSNGVKDDLISFYKIEDKKIDVIYNSCDVDNIHKQMKEVPDNIINIDYEKYKTVITAGRLTHQKGQWHLIRSFKEVVNKIPNALLLILGQGEEKEYLESLIKELNLENNVKLLGYNKNPYYYLEKSNVFVFSSVFEGFGNILLEAMACNLPIISTDCKVGPHELISPDTKYNDYTKESAKECKYGILVPVFDGIHYDAKADLTKEEKIMASEIIKVLLDEEIQNKYRQKSIIRIKDFNPEKIINEWEKVIEKM